MLDELAAFWDRLTGWAWRTAPGRRLNTALGRYRPGPPIADGYYLTTATRFEVGRLRNVMLLYGSKRQLRSLRGMLERWRLFPQSYLIFKRAENGRIVEPFAGGGVLMTMSAQAGASIAAGKRNWASIKTSELRGTPAPYIYAQFAEALEKEQRAILMRLLTIRVLEIGTQEVRFMARPVTEPALHFYTKRGFVRPDGSPPLLNEICLTQVNENPKLKAVLRALRATSNI